MDPRVAKANVSEIKTSEKIYTKSNDFSCLTTNKNGNVAVASTNGDIRLFKNIG